MCWGYQKKLKFKVFDAFYMIILSEQLTTVKKIKLKEYKSIVAIFKFLVEANALEETILQSVYYSINQQI